MYTCHCLLHLHWCSSRRFSCVIWYIILYNRSCATTRAASVASQCRACVAAKIVHHLSFNGQLSSHAVVSSSVAELRVQGSDCITAGWQCPCLPTTSTCCIKLVMGPSGCGKGQSVCPWPASDWTHWLWEGKAALYSGLHCKLALFAHSRHLLHQASE